MRRPRARADSGPSNERITDLLERIETADLRKDAHRRYIVGGMVAAGLAALTIYVNVGLAGPYVRLIQFGLLLAWAIYFTCLLRAAGRSVALTICSIAFSLIVLESVAHLAAPNPPHIVTDGSLYRNRPELGWGPSRPGTFPAKMIAADGTTIYDTAYTIDDALLRRTAGARGKRAIVFLGDSFTFGDGVADGETMPQAFADLTGRTIPVLNLGYSGYGPSQGLRALEAGVFDADLQAPRAFVLLTAAWHVERTACLPDFSARGPRYTWDGHALAYQGPCASLARGYLRSFLSNTAFFRVFLQARLAPRPNEADFETYAQIVAAIARNARERHGAQLIVFYIRSPQYAAGTAWSDDRLLARLVELGATVVDASVPARLDLIIVGDGHPNAAAHRMRANMLLDALRAEMPSVLQP